jgi:hypothetical protein
MNIPAVAAGIGAAMVGMGLLLIEPRDSERQRRWLAFAALAVVIAGLAVQTYFGAS